MLTDTQCRNAKPKDKPYKLADGKGLYLEVKPNGVKAWRYRFELVARASARKACSPLATMLPLRRRTEEQAKARRAGRTLHAGRGARGTGEGAGAGETGHQSGAPSPA